ncbi:XrtA/PEP-CTERM system-associated ATPase [Candidatus Moduliflexota bacterium]
MYEKYFNLKTKPFELVPNPDFLFLGNGHKKALTYLKYGISENIGFILMTGEVGSGKTTILRDLIKNLNGNVKLSKVFNTKVTSDQMIALINEDFGLDVSGKEKVGMLRELNDFLIDQHAREMQPILVIDEAQNLSAELLEEIRMLSNLETNMSKLLQIVLVGQPELRNTLALPELRQLRQRISISCHLLPLSREETESYIYHRLEKAGSGNSIRFHEGTIDSVHDFSRGVPRLVNIMCDFLLLTAFSGGTKEITADMAQEVAGELERENRFWHDSVESGYSGPGISDEISARLKKVEEHMLSHAVSPAEVTALVAEFASMKKSVLSQVGQLRSYLWETEVKVRTLAKEIAEIKKLAADQEKPMEQRKQITGGSRR